MQVKERRSVKVDQVHRTEDHNVSDDGSGTGDQCQVVLYNDDHNTCEHVVRSLMKVFGHSFEMAKKLMLEAHHKGKTIAQVEDREKAMEHAKQLQGAGLRVEVETIS